MQVIHPAVRALGYRTVFGLAYCQCLTRGMLAHHLTSRTNNIIIVNANYYHLVYCYYEQMSNNFFADVTVFGQRGPRDDVIDYIEETGEAGNLFCFRRLQTPSPQPACRLKECRLSILPYVQTP